MAFNRFLLPIQINMKLIGLLALIIVVIWLDSGDDLSRSPPGPWLSSPRAAFHTYFRPVIMYRPNISFKDHAAMPITNSASDGEDNELRDSTDKEGELPQSISLLAKHYGKSLNTSTMASDPFYLLSELFVFAATSKLEALNTVKSKLDSIRSGSNLNPRDPLNLDPEVAIQAQINLIHYRDVLEDHIFHIEGTLIFIQNRERLRWPRSQAQTQSSKALHAAERTEQDFKYLLERARLLQERCDCQLTTIMNNTTIEEARRGIEQAGRVFRFTLLAFTYVPLSFSSSVFGMTFVQFSDYHRGFWTWALVSLAVFAVSILIITWDTEVFRRWSRSVARRFWRP